MSASLRAAGNARNGDADLEPISDERLAVWRSIAEHDNPSIMIQRDEFLAILARLDSSQAEAQIVEREHCAKLLEMSNEQLKLMAGEMTARELRTTQAVLKSRAAAIRSGR